MTIIKTSTSWFNGAWEVWALVREDNNGGMSKKLLVRTADLDEAIKYEV